MKTKNADQLKAIMKNKALEDGVSAQSVLQNYLMERVLERISVSEYKNNFIIKGGFLLASIIGLNRRTTMDIDATLKGVAVTHDNIKEVFNKICAMKIDDDVTFEFKGSSDIRETDEYPGIRIKLSAKYEKLNVPVIIDVTTGDKITPSAVKHRFNLMFEDRYITLPSYNLETILSEKLETILTRSVANTRPRDFYDVYILYKFKKDACNYKVLNSALIATAKKRNSSEIIKDYKKILVQIGKDNRLKTLWNIYRDKFSYAKEITFDETVVTVEKFMDHLFDTSLIEI